MRNENWRNWLLGATVGLTLTAISAPALLAQTASLLPNAVQYFMDGNGKPLANGKVFFYEPGGTTPKTTWTTANESVPQANPVILGTSGRPVNPIYGDGSYRQIVKDQFNNVIWDFNTASTGSSSGGGVAFSEGVMVGTIIPWANTTLPTKYLYTAGQAISRTTYAQLLTALTFQTTILCQTTVATISVSTDISDKIPIGAPIEASCFAPGTVVSSKISGALTMSNAATATTSVGATFFPWGNGDGSTTFNVPDLRGRVMPGRDNMGGTAAGVLVSSVYGSNPDAVNAHGGSLSTSLARNQLPQGITSSGSNSISVGSSGRSIALSVTAGDAIGNTTAGGSPPFVPGLNSGGSWTGATSLTGNVTIASTSDNTGKGQAASATIGAGGSGYTAGTQLITVSGGTCTINPQFSVTIVAGAITAPTLTTAGQCTVVAANPAATTGGGGTGGTLNVTYAPLPLGTIPPSTTADYIIKALPDDLPSGPGVTSLGGMTGAIACGTNIVCTANTISVSPFSLSVGPVGYALIGNGASTATYQGFIQSGAGSATRTWNAKAAEARSVTDFTGTDSTGATDSTAGIAAAIVATPVGGQLWFPCGTYSVQGSGSQIFSRSTPIQLVGESASCVIILLTTSVPTNRDLFLFPVTGSNTSGWKVSGFTIANAGGTRGQHAIRIQTDATGCPGSCVYNSGFVIENNIISGFSGNSIYVDNDVGNAGGGTFNATFQQNILSNAITLSNAGDSIKILHNIITGAQANVYSNQVAGAGNLLIQGNNLSATGGVVIDAGDVPVIDGNEIELRTVSTEANGALIDINGGVRSVVGARIINNMIQVPAVLAGNPYPLRIGTAKGTSYDGNRLYVPAAYAPVVIAAGSNRASTGDQNVWDVAGTLGNPNLSVAGSNSLFTQCATSFGTATTLLHGATSGCGSFSSVALADMANINAGTLLGNFGGTLVPPEEVVPGATFGFTGNQLRTIAGTGDVTWGANTFTTVIANNAVTNAKAAQMSANGFKGNNTGGASNVQDLTVAQSQSLLLQGIMLGGKLSGANLNSTADQAITITSPTANYRILQILVVAKTGTFTTAVGGVYTAAAKGGVQVVANTQAYSALTSTTIDTLGNALIMGTANTNTMINSVSTIYLSLTTPQGGTSTADVYVFIMPLN